MISNVLGRVSIPFRAPADPDDTYARRRILERLRAADNDNPAPPRADEDEDRAVLLKPEFASRLIWRWLRDSAGSIGLASTWNVAAGDDLDMPNKPEASNENLWSVDKLMEAAHAGVDYKLAEDGRVVPYGGRSGALEYSKTTGRLIKCGNLKLADDTRRKAANDNDEMAERPEDKTDQVEIIGGIRRPTSPTSADDEETERRLRSVDTRIAALTDCDRRHEGNASTHDRRAPRAGSIIEILHRDRNGKVGKLTRPRNMDGSYRERTTEPPPPVRPLTREDVLDARQRLTGLLAVLSPETVLVLDHSIDAPNFKSIGELLGKSGDYAKRVGKQALIKACAELDSALQELQYKYAA